MYTHNVDQWMSSIRYRLQQVSRVIIAGCGQHANQWSVGHLPQCPRRSRWMAAANAAVRLQVQTKRCSGIPNALHMTGGARPPVCLTANIVTKDISVRLRRIFVFLAAVLRTVYWLTEYIIRCMLFREVPATKGGDTYRKHCHTLGIFNYLQWNRPPPYFSALSWALEYQCVHQNNVWKWSSYETIY